MRRLVFLACVSFLWTGCECGSSALIEAGMVEPLDAGNDAGNMPDAGDAGIDAGNDAGADASITECEPEMTRACYTGPPGTVNVGACVAGTETCNAEGSAWGECVGEVVPAMETTTEPGQPMVDEDCDNAVDEAP